MEITAFGYMIAGSDEQVFFLKRPGRPLAGATTLPLELMHLRLAGGQLKEELDLPALATKRLDRYGSCAASQYKKDMEHGPCRLVLVSELV
jgi:hypothetical protein